jgi:predicted nucleic acid-binding protein
MRLLLDTNLLIAPPHFDRLPEGRHELVTAALCYAELQEGEFSTDAAIRSRAPIQYLRAVQTYGEGLPFDHAAAALYRAVCRASHDAGRVIGRARRVDLMIAAVALAHDCALATRNPQDYAGLEQILDVIPL